MRTQASGKASHTLTHLISSTVFDGATGKCTLWLSPEVQGTPGTKPQLVPETAEPVKPTEVGTIWLVFSFNYGGCLGSPSCVSTTDMAEMAPTPPEEPTMTGSDTKELPVAPGDPLHGGLGGGLSL